MQKILFCSPPPAHLLLCDGNVEPLGQLVGLLLPQGVPGVRHEDGGHAERLRVGVHQLSKGLCSVQDMKSL